jgi:dihydroorotase
MRTLLIKNATIINNNERFTGSVVVEGEYIKSVLKDGEQLPVTDETINAEGKWLIPGVIDDQVHFREPGLTHKAEIATESKAAIAGGVTSFMEMPNTSPQTTTQSLLEAKYIRGSECSPANYSFYIGATNDNLDEILKTDPKTICGIKVFMGASTGNMLVDNPVTLEGIFKDAPTLVAVHCEDESIIRRNTEQYRSVYGEDIPIAFHPNIRSEEACYKSSSLAVDLASKYGTRLHILHLSTAKELGLFNNTINRTDKKITAEVCVHHLWFKDTDYQHYGARIKWNPAVKTESDRDALRKALKTGLLDVVATDHAPHTIEEKANTYFKCPSGGPLVQHSLVAMLEMCKQGVFTPELVVDKMCHAPADLYKIDKRGYIKEGYFADLVIINPNSDWQVEKSNILYKCGWSPFEGTQFNTQVTHTFVNGYLAFENGEMKDFKPGKRLSFNR